MYDIIIIGAGTAGLTAAVYALRSGKSVLILEGTTPGGQINFSPRVENYPGFQEISGSDFAEKLTEQAEELGADIEYEEVTEVKKLDNGKFLVCAEEEREAHAVIIATGTKHRTLGIAREESFIGQGVSYCAICDGAFYKGKAVAVVGGGSTALQSAELLSDLCSQVYLIHRRDEFRGEDAMVTRLRTKENVEFVLSSVVTELHGERELSAIQVKHNEGRVRDIPVEGLFVAVGQIPQNELFRGVVELDEQGYVIATENCETSVNGIYVAGDCRTKAVRQLTTAAADGAVAALAACAHESSE